MAGGITFGIAKESLRLVVENGVGDDPRVIIRTNEATQELLNVIIPAGGMATYDIKVDNDGSLLLPKELENAIQVEPLNTGSDVAQGWYQVVNPFTYVDPSAMRDNPLEDQFLVPDPADPTVLRRKYLYRAVEPGTVVRVTGAKRYLPLTSDSDYLIIQNVPALKLMIQAIEYRENRDPDSGMKYRTMAIEDLTAEVKKHLLDVLGLGRRKENYELALLKRPIWSMGWTRARLALEVPGALDMGKEDLTRLLERAEMRLLEDRLCKNSLEEFIAEIVSGHIYLPARVETVLAANLCGTPIPIRSIFYKYVEQGPGEWDCTCGGRLEDEGEEFFPNSSTYRRKYKTLVGSNGQCLTTVCKLRWLPKKPEEQMIVRSLEALRLAADAILLEQKERWNDANAAMMSAKAVIDRQLREHLSGIKRVMSMSSETIRGGIGSLGGVL